MCDKVYMGLSKKRIEFDSLGEKAECSDFIRELLGVRYNIPVRCYGFLQRVFKVLNSVGS